MRLGIVVLSLVMLYATGVCAQIVDPLVNPRQSDSTNARRGAIQTEGLRRVLEADAPPMPDSARQNLLNRHIRDLYRKPTRQETEILAPSAKLAESYSTILSQPHTGIIKLNADSRCSENSEVVSAVSDCMRYQIPGAGTSFSFRFESYRIPRLSDLILDNGILKIDGVYQQGVMVNLGDVPFELITLNSNGLKYLVDVRPVTDSDELSKIENRLGAGIKADGYVYGMGFFAKEKTTYAVRSIAFRGVFMRSLNGLAYDEFSFDKRKDVVVIFRVVEKDRDGNITIVWKELSRSDAPKLKISDPLLTAAK